MSNREALTVLDKEAIAFAFDALYFALKPDVISDFNGYLISVPRELTQGIELPADLEVDMPPKTQSRMKKKSNNRGRKPEDEGYEVHFEQ